MESRPAIDAAELAARSAYGRLVASIAVKSGDLAAAEDALSEAFVAALQQWPRDGVPEHPVAWLLAVARRRSSDSARRNERFEAALGALARDGGDLSEEEEIPDERLRLLFACAHPAIDESVRAPLLLQVVLGLDAQRIAAAMCVAPKTMGQRLWRAKTRIREAGIPFEAPALEHLPERVDAVLEAIYAAYGLGWNEVDGADGKVRDLGEEALWLARTTAELMPDEPEAAGLYALLLFSSARREARRDERGEYVPLSRQDPVRWDLERIALAELALAVASRMERIGPFQLEAAIQSAHIEERRTGRDVAEGLAILYEGLSHLAPTLGVLVSRAAAIARAHGVRRGIVELDEIPADEVRAYQPYRAVRAHVLAQLGDRDGAREAYELAIGLTEDAAVRRFLAAACATVSGLECAIRASWTRRARARDFTATGRCQRARCRECERVAAAGNVVAVVHLHPARRPADIGSSALAERAKQARPARRRDPTQAGVASIWPAPLVVAAAWKPAIARGSSISRASRVSGGAST